MAKVILTNTTNGYDHVFTSNVPAWDNTAFEWYSRNADQLVRAEDVLANILSALSMPNWKVTVER